MQRQDEQAQFENAQATQNQANLILANSASRLSSAQARDTQTLSRIARAQDAQDFLNRTRVGAEIPSQGLLDPDTGYRIYQREVSRFYDFSTGLRGAMPIGTVWELSLSAAQEKNTLFDQQYYGVAAITVGQPLLKNFLIDEGRTLLKTSKKTSKKPSGSSSSLLPTPSPAPPSPTTISSSPRKMSKSRKRPSNWRTLSCPKQPVASRLAPSPFSTSGRPSILPPAPTPIFSPLAATSLFAKTSSAT